jgi:iron-sulfur cluster repair protein YtfE (RIC family)
VEPTNAAIEATLVCNWAGSAESVQRHILEQHEDLRHRFADVLDVVTVLDSDDREFWPFLRATILHLVEDLRAHLELEHAVLVPALCRAEGRTGRRAQQLSEEHRWQAGLLDKLKRLADDDEQTADMLAWRLHAILSIFLDDMKREERELLPLLHLP